MQVATERDAPDAREATPVSVGDAVSALWADDCATCGGTWLSTDALQQLVDAAGESGALLGAVSGGRLSVATGSRAALAAATPLGARAGAALPAVTYRPCPVCARIMNRINYARASGVIVDVCRDHGAWFDANELPRVLAFIRRGGLTAARAREETEISEQRRQLEFTQQLARADRPVPPEPEDRVAADLLAAVFRAWARR